MTINKMTDRQFREWESDTLGFGYGTGEEHTITALKGFFESCRGETGQYDHSDVEKKIGTMAAWLVINILCSDEVIEYGTSPRFAWLSEKGQSLRDFVCDRSVEELLAILEQEDQS